MYNFISSLASISIFAAVCYPAVSAYSQFSANLDETAHVEAVARDQAIAQQEAAIQARVSATETRLRERRLARAAEKQKFIDMPCDEVLTYYPCHTSEDCRHKKIFCLQQAGAHAGPGLVFVNGYTRSDGTVVSPHVRTAPNEHLWDNLN